MSEQSARPDDRPVTCDDFDASVAELALEILDARERDVLMTHASTCERCTTELQQMSAAADRLTLLAPEGEPPVGFEQRVMDSLAVRQQRRRRSPVRPWMSVAAALVLFAVGLSVGLLVHRDSNNSTRVTQPATGQQPSLRYADLVDSAGSEHGSVSLVAGRELVLTMSVAHLDQGRYHCVVHLTDGTTHDVASWPVGAEGSGIWAVPIANTIADVRAVSVVNDRGLTLATATLP